MNGKLQASAAERKMNVTALESRLKNGLQEAGKEWTRKSMFRCSFLITPRVMPRKMV
jgi:hypothetical protein